MTCSSKFGSWTEPSEASKPFFEKGKSTYILLHKSSLEVTVDRFFLSRIGHSKLTRQKGREKSSGAHSHCRHLEIKQQCWVYSRNKYMRLQEESNPINSKTGNVPSPRSEALPANSTSTMPGWSSFTLIQLSTSPRHCFRVSPLQIPCSQQSISF